MPAAKMDWLFREHTGHIIRGKSLVETEHSKYTYECSACGGKLDVKSVGDLPNKCPKCGAVYVPREPPKEKLIKEPQAKKEKRKR